MNNEKFIFRLCMLIAIGLILIGMTAALSSIYYDWGIVIGGIGIGMLEITAVVFFREKSE